MLAKHQNVFLPYFINKGRLLDIYAILNDGYSEYSEISSIEQSDSTKGSLAKASLGIGFSLINIGGGYENSKSNSKGNRTQTNQKKVQTLPSILKFVLNELSNTNALHKSVLDLKIGDFLEIEAGFELNSIRSTLVETKKLLGLMKSLKINMGNYDPKTLDDIMKIVPETLNEEIVCDTFEYALLAHIDLNNLYQASVDDILSKEMSCLCQLKNYYSEGTSLLRNTIFSKLGKSLQKKDLIDGLANIIKNDQYQFDNTIIPEIIGKPVYEIEVIALYNKQKN